MIPHHDPSTSIPILILRLPNCINSRRIPLPLNIRRHPRRLQLILRMPQRILLNLLHNSLNMRRRNRWYHLSAHITFLSPNRYLVESKSTVKVRLALGRVGEDVHCYAFDETI